MRVIISENQLRVLSEQLSHDEILKHEKEIDIQFVGNTDRGITLSFHVSSGKPHEKVNQGLKDDDPKAYTYFPTTTVINVPFKLESIGRNPMYCKWFVDHSITVDGDMEDGVRNGLTYTLQSSLRPHDFVDKLFSLNGGSKNMGEQKILLNKLMFMLDKHIPEGKIDVDKI
jgi:hypothetical protein